MTDPKAKSEGCGGCIALILVAGMVQGGVVLIAAGLHAILSEPPRTNAVTIGAALAGVLMLFGAPRLLMFAGQTRVLVGWREGLASLPDFAMSGAYVLAWAAPRVIGHGTSKLLAAGMILEFIIIHASVALAAVPGTFSDKIKAWKARAGLVLLYSIFAAGMSAGFKSIWLFVGFWCLMLNKFIGDFLATPGETEERKQRHLARWGASAALYLFLAAGSVFIPVPELNAVSFSSGDGLWETHPERVMAMGALYYALLGFVELYAKAVVAAKSTLKPIEPS